MNLKRVFPRGARLNNNEDVVRYGREAVGGMS